LLDVCITILEQYIVDYLIFRTYIFSK